MHKTISTKSNKMNLSVLLLFLLNLSIIRGSKYRIYKKTNGFDHRHDIPDSTQQRKTIEMYRIKKYFEKKRIIDVLENPQIPIHVKSRIVEYRDIKPPNVFAGGLMKDFTFDMEEPKQ